MIPLVGVVAFIVAATTVPVEGPAPMSESVARVQLVKLGYPSITSLKRNGNYWEANVTKNGVPQVIRLNVLTGARVQPTVPIRRVPIEHAIVKPSA
ncbi:MAG TPA: hypothetical protein VGZ00_07705 [Candidatus Baltobacteraceae bacterium]|jgi:hypothetical protein|nr:hypothetical protein [Candidatus Baltobacteraceae bacterium]